MPNPIVLSDLDVDRRRLIASDATRTTSGSGVFSAPSITARSRIEIIFVVIVRIVVLGDVANVIQTTIYVVLVLVGRAVFAHALARTTVHEPYGVGDEFHWGAEDGGVCSGARGARAQVGCAIEIGVDAWVEGVGLDACFVDPERVTTWEFPELPGGVL